LKSFRELEIGTIGTFQVKTGVEIEASIKEALLIVLKL
jgi:hypothetical protein